MADVNISSETLARMAETVGQAVATTIAQHDEKIRPFEVTRTSGRSAFNPRAGEAGYKKPSLTRDTYFCGHQEDPKRLTPEEVALYNKITRPGRYHNRRWEVILTGDDQDPEAKRVLDIRIPCKEINDRMEMPNSLVAILKEIIEEAEKRDAAEKSKK